MKNRHKRAFFIRKPLVALLPALVVLLGSFQISAKAAGEKEQTIDVLLKENANIKEVKENILRKDKNIEVDVYEEINLMHLVYPETVDVDKIIKDKSIHDQIEVAGDLPKLEGAEEPVDKPGESDISSESTEELMKVLADDPYNKQNWHVDEVTEDEKSFEYTTGKNVRIAHIDSGVDPDHPVFSGKLDLKHAKSYVKDDDSINDYYGHGTETAGIIAQIAPDAIITPYKVLGAVDGESIWTIAAIIDAVNDGNDVLNLSLGTFKCIDNNDERILTATYKRAVRYALNNNVTVFASSGNKGEDLDKKFEEEKVLHLPGAIEGVNTVSSVWKGTLASYSCYGSCVDFCAPGGEDTLSEDIPDLPAAIFVAYPTYMDNVYDGILPHGYSMEMGTSLSSAVATASFADVYAYGKEKYPHFRKDDALVLLTAGCKDVGPEGKDPQFGNGEINIYRSIKELDSVYRGEVVQESDRSRSYQSHNIAAEYTITEEDEDRYYVNVTLTNNTSSDIHKWEIAMDLKDEITHIWDAKYIKDGDEIIVTHADYNQDIPVGESVSFGFIAKKPSKDKIALPNEVLMVNDRNMVKPEDYSADLEVTTRWEDGFVAYMTITNKSDHPISDWKIEFTYSGNIDKIWGASIEEHDDDYYSILNEGSNQNIAPGKSVSFGFETDDSTDETIDNISLISTNK